MSLPDDARVAAALAECEAAHASLSRTVEDVRARLAPAALADRARIAARKRMLVGVERTARVVADHPYATLATTATTAAALYALVAVARTWGRGTLTEPVEIKTILAPSARRPTDRGALR